MEEHIRLYDEESRNKFYLISNNLVIPSKNIKYRIRFSLIKVN